MADIFICYRRKDSAGHAGRLVRDLSARFPGSTIFHDMDSLHAGVPFRSAINTALNSSEALLAVVGPHWRTSIHRLQNPDDYVRIEIEIALERDITVIPVLVGGASVPTPEELPQAIAGLADRQAHEITDKRWDYDVQTLAEELCALLRLGGSSGIRARIGKLLAGVSVWLYTPLVLFAILVVLATITRIATGGEFAGPPSGLPQLGVSLMQDDVPEEDRNCIKPLDCGSQTSAGNRLSEDIRLRNADIFVDVEQQELHILLSVSWTLREGKTNLVHRGYTGKMYYVAAYSRDLTGDRIRVSGLDYRGDSLAPYNGLIAYTFGWFEVRTLRDRDDILTGVITNRINEAPGTQALL
jgi:hypothetical protein